MNTLQTRWRGKLPIPPKAHPLIRTLVALANEQMTTMQEIADRAGMQPKTISNWRYIATPRVKDLEAALNVLGYELHIREKRT